MKTIRFQVARTTFLIDEAPNGGYYVSVGVGLISR